MLVSHGQAYINNLNAAMEKLADAEAKGDVTAILQLQAAIKFNGGGHLNHSIFWKARGETESRGEREFKSFTTLIAVIVELAPLSPEFPNTKHHLTLFVPMSAWLFGGMAHERR